jgi:hypothetical protein
MNTLILFWLIADISVQSSTNKCRTKTMLILLESTMFARRLAMKFCSLVSPQRPPVKLHNPPPAAEHLIPYRMLSEMQCPLFDRQLLAYLDPESLSAYRPTWGLDSRLEAFVAGFHNHASLICFDIAVRSAGLRAMTDLWTQ